MGGLDWSEADQMSNQGLSKTTQKNAYFGYFNGQQIFAAYQRRLGIYKQFYIILEDGREWNENDYRFRMVSKQY
jgi:hypothetical protein